MEHLLPEALAGIATVAILFAIVRRTFGRVAATIAGIVTAVTPVAVLIFRYNNPDALLTVLFVLAAWAFVRGLEHGRIRWAVLGAAAVALVVSSAWRIAAMELIPASARPFVGGSTNGSALDLVLGYDGLGRIFGMSGPGGSGGGGGFSGTPGILRLFNAELGGQIAWLLPFALVALAAGLLLRGRAPRTDMRRAAYLMWGLWLAVTSLVFSFMSGVIHSYYAVALVPAVAALVGGDPSAGPRAASVGFGGSPGAGPGGFGGQTAMLGTPPTLGSGGMPPAGSDGVARTTGNAGAMPGGGGGGAPGLAATASTGTGSDGTASTRNAWVTSTCTLVDYGGTGTSTLYDCAGAVTAGG